jgi:cytosine/adenosine deaminase-related metal-dependent hydrolase/SAM-dependent methyltransferase
LGAPIHQSPQAEGRKPLVGSRGAVPVSPLAPTTGLPARDGYRLASGVYDAEPNPMLALEERFLEKLLPAVDGLDIVDLGCGTGRWLAKLADKDPRSLVGVDFSPEMLSEAKRKLGGVANLVVGDCADLPLPRCSADLILCSFLTSYQRDLDGFSRQVRRTLRPGGRVFLTDLHPETTTALGWRRGFHVGGSFVDIATYSRSVGEILLSFEALSLELEASLEPRFGEPEREIFERAGKIGSFTAAAELPVIYILQLRLKPNRAPSRRKTTPARTLTHLAGARIALGPQESIYANVAIEDGRIALLESKSPAAPTLGNYNKHAVDLRGFLLLPGLVNSHDHLEFALFPRLGAGGYRNYVEWANDIHRPEDSPVREHRAIGKSTRLWWGGIRNLLCGVTTVCHHNPYVEEVFDNAFAVRVVRDFSWAHSIAIDRDLVQKQKAGPPDRPFILHLAEGVDAESAAEIFHLAGQRALNDRSVVVHGLALDELGLSLLRSVNAALIWCPTSNVFLFGRTHDRKTLKTVSRLALGNDSPLTAAGDLLDEIRFAFETVGVGVDDLYTQVTAGAADVLRLKAGEGTVRIGSLADFIAVRDDGRTPAHRLASMSHRDVEFVVIGGRVQLASTAIVARLPRLVTTGLRPLDIDGEIRWIRAPLNRLFAETQTHLAGDIKLGGRTVRHGQPV